MLQACASAPEEPPMQPATAETMAAARQPAAADSPAASEQPESLPELNLDLKNTGTCVCPPSPAAQRNFLERGFSSLAAEEYVEAVQHFQRHRRLEDTPAARWEAGIAIAYVSMLTDSPLYDAEAARKSYRKIRKQPIEGMQVHEQTLLMRLALESFVVQDRHIADLTISNATLKEDLARREEAIKRLRELTLGQKGSSR